MWLQLFRALLLFPMARCSCTPVEPTQINYGKRRWIKTYIYGIGYCDKQCAQNGAYRLDGKFSGSLCCKTNKTALALMTIWRHHGHRTAQVTVYDKNGWLGCPNLVCSVTRNCAAGEQQEQTREKVNISKSKGKFTKITLKAIAASSRYRDIVYGLGTTVRTDTPFVSFNVTKNFAVKQQILVNLLDRGRKRFIRACGLTTGLCLTLERQCVYLCFGLQERGRYKYKICLFDEPDIGPAEVPVNSYTFPLADGQRVVIASIAVSDRCVIYSLEHRSGKINIRATALFQYSDGSRHADVLFVRSTVFKPISLDITKRTLDLHLFYRDRSYVLKSQVFRENAVIRYEDVHEVLRYKDTRRCVCLLRYSNHVVFIEKYFPYRAVKVLYKS